jgi:DnaJ-class molecular chaperone
MAKHETPEPQKVTCPECNGVGTVLGIPDPETGKADRVTCKRCGGNGTILA